MFDNIRRWSFSALNQFMNCPYRYYTNKLGPRENKEPFTPSKAMADGDYIHKQVHNYFRLGLPLEQSLKDFPDQLQIILNVLAVLDAQGVDLTKAVTERQIFLRKNAESFDAKDNFDKAIWLQTDCDLLAPMKADPNHWVLVDWKTGKKFGTSLQPATNALAFFAAEPDAHRLDTYFAYFKSNDIEDQTFYRAQMTEQLKPLVYELQEMDNAIAQGTFAKRKTGLCQYCEVKTCAFSKHNQT